MSPIPVATTHLATLTVPVSGNPAQKVEVSAASDGRSVTFQATGASPEEAQAKIRGFLQAALAATQ
jgi:hypothetical protein